MNPVRLWLAVCLLQSACCFLLPAMPAARRTATRSSVGCSSNMIMSASPSKRGVLFICLGNICRSPAAEAVFKSVVSKKGTEETFQIDSCGTGGGNPNWYVPGGFSYHEGDSSDGRMKRAAAQRGITITSTSRPLTPDDIGRHDLLVCMDGANKSAVLEAAGHWGLYEAAAGKVKLMTEYCTRNKGVRSVPDPYYGGEEGFERVLDLLEDACEGLHDALQPPPGGGEAK